ncbi:hypothetical protein Dda_6968 [Drechslerella dactyloides]|uniref:Azaphilone pigments biosynthesis cluster protein L N-terminal domain-containing protein n=1 Tax=Drechslerella dactyloides TaxID=74499 RepID=A0AAD6NFX5_DREDA|nr:hypothetical protein Dda_6968 [Drechslerella dactyloides]
MADHTSLTSGRTLQDPRTLHATVNSFKSTKRVLRELSEGSVVLEGVLVSLQDTNSKDADLTALGLPLQNMQSPECSAWAMILLASGSYCSLQVDDNDHHLRRQHVNSKFRGRREGSENPFPGQSARLPARLSHSMIESTSELEEQLDNIVKKLKCLAATTISDRQTTKRNQEAFQADKKSIEQCIEICARLLGYINRVQMETAQMLSADPASPRVTYLSKQLTANIPTRCEAEPANTTTPPQEELDAIEFQLAAPSEHQETLGSAGRGLTTCTRASERATSERINIFEDVKALNDDSQAFSQDRLGDSAASTVPS